MPEIQKVHYTHDALIDQIVSNPGIDQRQLAKMYGYTEAWVSTIVNSDSFKARLQERKADLIDPLIVANFEERLKGTLGVALSVINEKLETGRNADLALKTLELGAKALSFGARPSAVNLQQAFVIQVPAKAPSAADWAAQYNDVGSD